jgi:hypothetical protein
MNDLFLETEAGVETAVTSEQELVKALSAGYGTDSAQYVGGRAMIPEDIEITMINAMREQKEDCKMMNLIKKRPVRSTVHEYNRRYDVGDYENATAGEGEGSPNTEQTIQRVTVPIKYLQTRRAVTDQMEIVDSFENAFESEKLSGTLTILKAAERLCFHGDSDVVPTEWDGLPKLISKLPENQRHVKDYRGKTIATIGDEVVTDMMHDIADAGGDANILFFPLILTMDLQNLVRDRVRFGTDDKNMAPVLDAFPTPFGTLKFGNDVGPNKFYRVKGPISPNGDPNMRPNAPSNVVPSVAAATQQDGVSKFYRSNAGDYRYSVHAVNQYGISPGFSLVAAVAVAAGDAVKLTITRDASKPGTGFIICRSKKNGNVVMEIARIGNSGGTTTVFTDLNDDLPGTANMLFLTEKKLQTVVEFYQLMPLRMRPLFESNRAEKPFFIQLFGAPDLKVPRWCGIAKNISYKGGFTY